MAKTNTPAAPKAAEPTTDRGTPAKVDAQKTAEPKVADGKTKTVNQTNVVDNTEAKRPEPKKAEVKREESANGTTIVSYS